MHPRPAGSMHRPPCQCSTSGGRRAGHVAASSYGQPAGTLRRQAAGAPLQQPSLAPLVIDTGEYRCVPWDTQRPGWALVEQLAAATRSGTAFLDSDDVLKYLRARAGATLASSWSTTLAWCGRAGSCLLRLGMAEPLLLVSPQPSCGNSALAGALHFAITL